MPRIEVPFVVKKQHIIRATDEDLVAGGQNYFYAIFEIGNTWKKISNPKALFVRDDVQKLMDLTVGADCLECKIPWEVMATAGIFHVGIFGGDRLLTNYAYVKVKKGCLTEGDEPEAPTPDWFTEMEKMCNDAIDTATSIEERANNGEFDGKDGEQGAKGDPGKTPVKGEDYFTEDDKAEIVQDVLAALPNLDEVGY